MFMKCSVSLARKASTVFGLSAFLLSTASPLMGQVPPESFAISVGGVTVAGNEQLTRLRPKQQALGANWFPDITVTADGLGVRPRLSLDVLNAQALQVTVQSRMNYPLWIARSEVELIRFETGQAPQTVYRTTIPVNGRVTLAVPKAEAGQSYGVVHRVFDPLGRIDETRPISIDSRGIAEAEEGRDDAAKRNIPVSGGAVTVAGQNLLPGQSVRILGETISADPAGNFVLQRIMPTGDHVIAAQIAGKTLAQQVVSIPKSEWFGTGLIDLTFGRGLSGPRAGQTWDSGRAAFYAKGKTAEGWQITASADSGTGPIRDIFTTLDDKDPLGLIGRLDAELAYPTYGDDAEFENDAPTDGKFYLKLERDGNHLMWGNFDSRLTGSHFLRDERRIYGAQGVWKSQDTAPGGEARISATLHAALPDRLPGRDVFLGTGGSIYFLSRQDIATGSETLMIELRDPVTGRIVDRRALMAGKDYAINYLQGSVMLTAPLSASSDTNGVVQTSPSDDLQNHLVVSYEFSPLAGDVDGYALGGRAEAWVADNLRLGITGTREQSSIASQTATSVDVLWTLGTNSNLSFDFARSDGPGFGQTSSGDGGLAVVNIGAGAAGSGTASRLAGTLALADIGLAADGKISFWSEDRRAGFATRDHSITEDERDSGIRAEISPRDGLTYRFNVEDFHSGSGAKRQKAGAEVAWVPNNANIEWAFGVSMEDRVDPAQPAKTGAQTDIAVRATVTQSDDLKWYVFGQGTAAVSGGRSRNDRIGVGAIYAFGKGWKTEVEASTGTLGFGAKALVRKDNEGRRLWIGYALEPGRELAGVTLNGQDQGRMVIGAEADLSADLKLTGENSYDVFGSHRSLISRYGVEYRHSDALSFTTSLDVGKVSDPVAGDFDRTAVSFGVRRAQEDGLTYRARVEYRNDNGTQSNAAVDTRSFAVTGDAEWVLTPEERVLASLAATRTIGSTPSTPEASYLKASLGYAFRPIIDDRLNFLMRHTLLHDLYGQRVDGASSRGPRQRSNVFSADLTYDVSDKWTLGAKLGYRLAETASTATAPFVRNDAALVVLNARYHMNHNWDVLIEGRSLRGFQSGVTETGFLGTIARQVGDNLMLGVGYNFGNFSDDLTDLVQDDRGAFINLVAKW